MPSVGEFLIDRLHRAGIKHAFGVPGDYVLNFYKKLSESPIEVIGTTSESAAGFAADAYARMNGP
jgi:indolepyruvate decarboxylase